MNYQFNLERDPIDERDYLFSSPYSLVKRSFLPASVDLRPSLPEVFDQGSIGSCTGQAGAIAAMVLNRHTNVKLSPLALYYFERMLEGTIELDGGATMRTIGRALTKFGIPHEASWPYLEQLFAQIPNSDAITEALSHKAFKYTSITSLHAIQETLAISRFPVLIGMQIYPRCMDAIGEDGYLSMPGQGEELAGGHAVAIVGYKSLTWRQKLKQFFAPNKDRITGWLIIRNSWSKDWGDNGYFYMPYEFLTQGHAFDFWVIS